MRQEHLVADYGTLRLSGNAARRFLLSPTSRVPAPAAASLTLPGLQRSHRSLPCVGDARAAMLPLAVPCVAFRPLLHQQMLPPGATPPFTQMPLPLSRCWDWLQAPQSMKRVERRAHRLPLETQQSFQFLSTEHRVRQEQTQHTPVVDSQTQPQQGEHVLFSPLILHEVQSALRQIPSNEAAGKLSARIEPRAASPRPCLFLTPAVVKRLHMAVASGAVADNRMRRWRGCAREANSHPLSRETQAPQPIHLHSRPYGKRCPHAVGKHHQDGRLFFPHLACLPAKYRGR